MNTSSRPMVWMMMFCVALLAACGKSEPPPPPKVEPPKAAAPAVTPELQRLAAEVYVFAYPMVVTALTREGNQADGLNTFRHTRTIPDAATVDTANPNADFLYSQAWLDLASGPVFLSVPDTRGRYYLLALLDAWTNVAASIGKRTTTTEKREFAIVGPRWKGKLPEGVVEVRSPTELAWIFGRTAVGGKADLAAATKLQDQFRLKAAATGGKRDAKAAAAASAPTASTLAPREQIAQMDAATFFTRVAMLLPGNPLAKDDAPMAEKIQKLGLVAGQPFDATKLDPVSRSSVEEGAKSALNAIATAAKGSGSADIRNGWRVDRALGRWGTEYGRRAVAAWIGLGLNAPEDAIFMSTPLDGAGHRLDGANRYVLHFDAGKLPPADGFWSLSLYNAEQRFVANPASRFHLGSEDRLTMNPDGSLDIHIQKDNPGKGKDTNWLPAPAGSFNVILRIYWPKQEVIDGHWNTPGIRRAT